MRKTLQKSAAVLMLSLLGGASGWAQSTLYSIDFTASEPTGWTTVDKSTADGTSTWFYGKGAYRSEGSSYAQVNCARLSSDANGDQDDYYVSPGVELTAGKTYVVSLSNQVQNSPTSLGLEVGTSATDMSANTVLRAEIPLGAMYYGGWYEYGGNNYASVSTCSFTPETSGTYYFSMRGKEPVETTDDNSLSRIFVYNFSVSEAKSTELPYSVNFIETTEGWSAIDANNSGKTITKDASYKYYVDGYDETQAFPYMQNEYYDPADEYWVSPAFALKAGQSYSAAFDVLQLYGSNTFAGNVALVVGKYNDDASSFEKVADLTLASEDPEWTHTAGSTDPHVFAVNEDGQYYIAAHVTGHEGSQTYVYLGFKGFNLSESTATPEVTIGEGGSTPDIPDVETKALPYTVDFSVENSEATAEWTTVDKSPTPGTTWAYGSKYTESGTKYGYWIESDDTNSDDYLVSPAFKLEAGKTYQVDLAHYAFTYGADLFIEYGTNKDDVTTFTQLVQTPRATVNGELIEGPYKLTVPADGVYYIALRGKANLETGYGSYYTYLLLSSFGLSEKAGGNPDTPDPGEETTAEIPYSITFDSADKFATWSTLDNSDTAGSTWVYTASDFAGKPAAFMGPDAVSTPCDWIISPRFELKEGKSYSIKLDAASGEGNTAELYLDYFAGSKDKNNFNVVSWIGKTLPATSEDGQEPKTEWTFDCTKDGAYYFALRAIGWNQNNEADAISIYSVNITEKEDEVDEPVALPYETSFATEDGAAGWTAMDRSDRQSSTWSYNSWGYQEYDENWTAVGDAHPCVGYNSDWDTNANDYWISPAFELTAGNVYTVKTLTTTNRTCFDDNSTLFTMKLGTNKKVQSSFDKTIGTIALNTVYDRDADTFQFTVPESGKYYLAYNIANDNGQNAYGYIFNFSLSETVIPTEPLPYSITFDSADKFATWSTFDNSDTPGKTWEYTASDFAGKPAAFMGVDETSETCDFLISPKFELEAGKTYVFKADMASGEGNQLSLLLDYFKGSASTDNLVNYDWVGATLPKTVDGEVQNEWIIDIKESGAYYFAFRALNRAVNEEGDAISVYSMSLAEEADDPVALPYETNFATKAGTKGWKAFDCSEVTGVTWSWSEYGYQEFDDNWNTKGDPHACVAFGPEWDGNANDYWTSPKFTLEAGKTYKVTALTTASKACIEDGSTTLTLKLGKERKVEASYDKTIGDITLNSVFDRDADTFEFTVPESGDYHVAFNAVNNVDGNKAYVYVFNFSIAENQPTDGINSITTAIPADAKVAVYSIDGAQVGNDLTTLAKGTYIVKVKTADGNVKTMKITK